MKYEVLYSRNVYNRRPQSVPGSQTKGISNGIMRGE